MPFLKLLNENLLAILGITTTVGLLIPKVRAGAMWVVRWITRDQARAAERLETQRARAEILGKLDAIAQATEDAGTRIAAIEKEMKFNGGKSVKDMLFLMFNYRRHDFWRLGIPAMEMDGDGHVTLVSEAACKLFGVLNPDDLKRRSWLRFLERGTVDDLLHAFRETTAAQSEFSATLRIFTLDGDDRGQWELSAAPISEESATTKIYTAHLRPMDEAATRAATAINWSYFRCKNCVR